MGAPLTTIDLLIITATAIATFIGFRKLKELTLTEVILFFNVGTIAGLYLEKYFGISGKLIWSVNFIIGTGIFLKSVNQLDKSLQTRRERKEEEKCKENTTKIL